jgi:two-component system chemotaxis response regulator CheB
MLAQRLDSTCQLTVREAVDGEPLEPGVALIAPGGRHLEVHLRGQGMVTRLTDDPPENYCRPAVDVLFRSVGAAYRDRALGLVLTGMGRDGAAGARDIRAAGGAVIAQDEASSVVWGMPGAVATSGQADEILPLTQIATHLTAALVRRPIPAGAS